MDRESSKNVYSERLPRRRTSRSSGQGEALNFLKEGAVIFLALAYYGAHFVIWWAKDFRIVDL